MSASLKPSHLFPKLTPMMTKIFGLSLLFLLLFSPIFSQDQSWKETINSQHLGTNRNLKPIALTYSLSWQGLLRAGETTLEFSLPDPKSPSTILCKSYGRSVGLARTLYPYEHNFVGKINRKTWRPEYFWAWEKDKSETKTTIVNYRKNHASSREVTKNVETGQIVSTRKQEYHFNPLYDFMSAVMYFRSLEMEPGQFHRLVIHPGNRPYLVLADVTGYDQHLSLIHI